MTMTMNEFVYRLFALVQAFHKQTDPDEELKRVKGTSLHPKWWKVAESMYKGFCASQQAASGMPPRIRLVKGGKDGTPKTS